jgi:O-antigen ligase
MFTSISNNKKIKTLGDILIPIGVPITLALILGLLLAFFIVNSNWVFVFGLLILVLAVILFIRYPFSAIMIWILLMPFLQTTINPAFRNAYWLIHRAMPVMAVVGYIVFSKRFNALKRRSFPKPSPADIAILFFLSITLINIFVFQADRTPYLILIYDRIFVPICLYFFVRIVEPREMDFKRFLPIIFVLVVIETFVGLLSQTAVSLIPAEWASIQGERAVGTFDNAHGYTMSLAFFILLLYHGAMQTKSKTIRVIYLIGVAMGLFGVLISFTRGSWLGSFVVGLGLIALYPKQTLKFGLILIAGMVVLSLTVFSTQLDFAGERISSEDTALDRLVIWDAGRQLIERKPFFGWGYGDYSEYAPQFQQRVQNYVSANPHASHNALITIAAEIGIPGLLAFLFPVFWWLVNTPSVWSKMPKSGFWSRQLLGVLWLVILDILVETTFTDARHSTYVQGIWWITLAFIANIIYSYNSRDNLKIHVKRINTARSIDRSQS